MLNLFRVLAFAIILLALVRLTLSLIDVVSESTSDSVSGVDQTEGPETSEPGVLKKIFKWAERLLNPLYAAALNIVYAAILLVLIRIAETQDAGVGFD